MLRFENPKIARLYKDVPPDQVGRLHQFRADHPYQHAIIDRVDWSYIVAGQGDATLLVLPGALGAAELGWQTISRLADRPAAGGYRVIAPCYPPSIATLVALVDGIAQIMQKEGVGTASVMGGSFGGFIAQVFVRRHPGRVEKLIISHAGLPNPARGQKIRRALRWLPLLPMGALRAIARKRLSQFLPQENGRMAFIRAHVLEHMNVHLTKEGFLNTFRCMLDLDLHCTFAPQDLADWPGEVLLIMADDDPTTPEAVREALKALYPQAQVHEFCGTGHLSSILRQEEYLSVIGTFLG